MSQEKFLQTVVQRFSEFFQSMNALCSENLRKNHLPVVSSAASNSKNHESTVGLKKRVKKDPNAPKAAKSSYIFFCAHVRQKYPEKLNEIKFAEQSAVLGREWAKLPQAKKDIFKGLQDKDKKRYEKELAQYESEHGIEKKVTKARATKTTKPPTQIDDSNIEQIQDDDDDDEVQVIQQDESDSIEVEEKPKKKVKK